MLTCYNSSYTSWIDLLFWVLHKRTFVKTRSVDYVGPTETVMYVPIFQFLGNTDLENFSSDFDKSEHALIAAFICVMNTGA